MFTFCNIIMVNLNNYILNSDMSKNVRKTHIVWYGVLYFSHDCKFFDSV